MSLIARLLKDCWITSVRNSGEIPMNKKSLRILLLGGGAVLIILGVALDEAVSVYAKAVRICLECIGIG